MGALAVFVSLLYLAIQIRSSRRSDQIVAASEAASAVDQWIGQIVRDDNLYDLYRRGLVDYESLSIEEKGRFALLILQFLRGVETVWSHRRLGVIDTSYWSSLEVAVVRVIGTDGGRRGFRKHVDTLTPEFSTLIESILDRQKSSENVAGNGSGGSE